MKAKAWLPPAMLLASIGDRSILSVPGDEVEHPVGRARRAVGGER